MKESVHHSGCTSPSKILRFCVFAVALLSWHSAQAVSLPYYDGFSYSEGRLNDVGSPNWFAGSTGYEISVSNSATLTAPAGFPPETGKGVRRAPSGSARRSVIQYTSMPAVDGNTVHVSFLLNVQTPPDAVQLLGYLEYVASSDSAPQCGIFLDSGPKVGVGKNSSSPGFTMATNLGAGTHLVVVRYTFQAGNDRVDLWVDPASGYYGAGTAPDSLGSYTGGSDPVSLDYFQFYAPGNSSGGIEFTDEVRLGTTWADVVPSSGSLVGVKLGFTSQPTDAQVNTTMNPVVVQVQTSGGGSVPSNNVPITLTLSSGSGTLSGTTTRNTDATGKATFNDLSIDTVGTGKQLTASASGIGAGLTNATSSSFAITLEPPLPPGTPVITSSQMKPGGFALGGENGTPNALYNVLASPDADLPLADWIAAKYAHFNSSGHFACTNPVSPALPIQFYRLIGDVSNTKTVPPSITQSPANQTVASGSTVILTVTATGPLLQYLWYFNGSPIAGATNATLTLDNVQASQAGDYHVIVANGAGSVTSGTATLRVGNYAPTITSQPQDQTNTVGGTAILAVVADGTIPLGYQWYHITALPNTTNAQLTLSNLTTNDAGGYYVVVTNAFGSTNSATATLTVNPIPTAPVNTNMVGFAAYAGVTGGAGGSEVTASDYTAFRDYCRQAGPLIIHVQGALVANENYTYVDQPNKTIIGDGTNAALYGDLRLNATNIIVQNMYFVATNHSDADGITIDTSSHGTGKYIWVDHCTFYDCKDGSLDITKGTDYITVSWCKFYYSTRHSPSHEYVNLIASSDDDDGSQYHVTFHHNWYGTYSLERMPSVRFGRVHVFNNYYDCIGNNYCVRTRINAQVLVENNYFIGVQNPWERYVTSGSAGLLYASGNITNSCIWNPSWTGGVVLIPGTDTLSDLNPPPYSYTLDAVVDVPYYVQTYAGSGKYPYVAP